MHCADIYICAILTGSSRVDHHHTDCPRSLFLHPLVLRETMNCKGVYDYLQRHPWGQKVSLYHITGWGNQEGLVVPLKTAPSYLKTDSTWGCDPSHTN